MQYAPAIESAHQRQKFRVGRYTVILFDQIVSSGPAKYLYLVIALDDSHHTRLYVTAEVNPMAKRFGGGSHFLGVFDGTSHVNHGSSDEWADGEKFLGRAVQLIREKSVADMKSFLLANAELLIHELRPLSGMDFGFTGESVEWLEGHIERLRVAGQFQVEETKTKLAGMFGSFLGECIIRRYGGDWTEREGMWVVAFDGEHSVFPMGKAWQQMDHGLADGIGGFFRSIAVLHAGRVR